MEVTDGLRVLGVPVGTTTFCKAFISKAMKNAATESTKVLAGLESEQTMLQLFRQCTVHKLMHLYASDVASKEGDTNDTSSFPENWDCWSSAMTTDFTQMVNNFLCALTKQKQMPLSAQLLSTILVNNGGLGISHPQAVAILYLSS